MPATIVVSSFTPTTYINEYKTRNNIPLYNIKEFSTKLKIADAREIIKFFSTKLDILHSRLVVVTSEITIDAQNALLKCIEELPTHAHIILVAQHEDVFLPTVLSRCNIVRLSVSESKSQDQIFDQSIRELLSGDKNEEVLRSLLYISDRIETLEDIENLINSLRVICLDEVNNGEVITSRKLVNTLEEITNNFSLFKTNNVNKRFAVERILMENFLKNTP